MPSVRMNHIDCYYEVHGSGSPLVLIAGLASDSQSWKPVLNGLAERFKVIIFDNRGIGRTHYPPTSFSISTLALDVVSLLDVLLIEKANILGHSMGGCIAQEIAISAPEKVDRLILVNTCATASQQNKLLCHGMLETLESGKNYELFIREFFRWIFTPEYLGNKTVVESAVKDALHYPFPITPEGFRKQLEAWSGFNSSDRLNRIKAATLLMAGKKDRLITSEETQKLTEKIPHAKTLYLQEAAHSFQVEQPDLFVNHVIEFLCRPETRVQN